MTDALADAADSLIAAGVDACIVRQVLRQVRARWAGQVYIKQTDPFRDDEIRERIDSGEPMREVARKVGVSISTVKRRKSSWL